MPDRSKLVFYKHKGSIVLSDCIFALKADLAALMRLYEKLLENWARLERLYRGTGAKYLTGSDVANVLGCLGFSLRPADGKNHQLLRALNSRQLEFSSEYKMKMASEFQRLCNRQNDQDLPNPAFLAATTSSCERQIYVKGEPTKFDLANLPESSSYSKIELLTR
jgi:hypothetical protein